MNSLVLAVERSADAKLSPDRNVSATWVAQQSCPPCPLRNNGCYAEVSFSGIQSRRLNKNAGRKRLALAPLRRLLARQEADAIRGLSGTRQLRVHVVGDCPTAFSARHVGAAMVEHVRKFGKAAWTYTHAWRQVPRTAWQGASVLASCNSVKEVAAARARGYAASVITPPHPSNKVYTLNGETIVPCPAQFKLRGKRAVTCEDCTLCKRPDFLLARRMSVGFQPDGGTQKKVLAMLQAV